MNHGCEALVRSISKLLPEELETVVLSDNPEQDELYLNQAFSIIPARRTPSKMDFRFLLSYLALKLSGNYKYLDSLPYLNQIGYLPKNGLAISIGGDVYCYGDQYKYIDMHNKLRARGYKSILLGCSLEEYLFQDNSFVEHLNRFDMIYARESLTLDILRRNNIRNCDYLPDPAFLLEREATDLPIEFLPNQTVGLNVSPLILADDNEEELIKCFVGFIDWIISCTDMNVALIPHVVWEVCDDRLLLKKIYSRIKDSSRVSLIEDQSCIKLKYIISKCRFFMGARTHATIAAYSTGIPTIAFSYSIKSKGIAKDLFGSYANYVIDKNDLTDLELLKGHLNYLIDHEQEIKDKLIFKSCEYRKKLLNSQVIL